MIRAVRQNKESVLDKIRAGRLDVVHLSTSSLVDDIILAMHKNGVLSCLKEVIPDKRKPNTTVPFELVLALSAAAKMKVKTALTDIPFAIQDHRLLGELGYNIISDKDVDKGIMTEGSLRHLWKKYEYYDFFIYYNKTVQNHILKKLNLKATKHILDCTKLKVEYWNDNYELSETATDSKGKKSRGYKLGTIRSLINNTGIITDICFGGMANHDLSLCENMLFHSPILKPGDMIINDRGFLDRNVFNILKTTRKVDTYMPLKKGMTAFNKAIETAIENNKWSKHPNKKRPTQKIAFVGNLQNYWKSKNKADDVDFNACVVWDTAADNPDNEYRVFITSDLTKSARQIIQTYELRPEIEEDYRQLKDFWKIEDFKPTQIHLIAFHIMSVLFGYLFFQLYMLMPDGERFLHKSLPVVLKNYQSKAHSYLVFYVDDEFGILTLVETMRLYASVL